MTELSAFPLPFLAEHLMPVAPPRTLRELQMMRLSAEIREKPHWFVKRNDPGIVAKWTREATEQGLTDAQIRYVLAELERYAELRDEASGIEVSAVDGVWQSDTLIEDELKTRLREAVRVLEEVPDAERDWHPGSHEQVLDLVHPSLFCLVRGVSGIDDSVWPTAGQNDARYACSEKFQWLPTDVDIDADGHAVFRSYVNNVHPIAHRDLDSVLPLLFARLRPLFENVLTDLRYPQPRRIKPDPYSWYHDEPVRPDTDDVDAMVDYDEAWDEWWDNRRPVVPDAPEYSPPALPDDYARVDLRGRRLQVIVKLANIHLTPDRPEYAGGSWHVEGMMNERIVSTGIYYWDSENITASRLSFRAAIDDPDYEQNDSPGMRDVYGLEDEDALNQGLGSVPTTPNRCLAFPNILQHRVAPFRLADPTRPGHRKILAFFLVDPSVTVISTSDVPPQQPWSPTSTMTLDQAKQYREELMRERKFFVDEHNQELYEREFSLCEH
ncbi:DUF4246 domain-containing protein [Nocardia sp. CDC160]|uniref:DUF4246 domain-containing protein n=1 Tax=Nocardia sp. CDC160 TaxID=3112166 RepID=UPI002DB6D065|nr:DUF4246 domain-containing protein [Nocardia sp. CDC160]MEC3918524.1 DUF4246 domain-containing protein [Nocardia sp. CDC160]